MWYGIKGNDNDVAVSSRVRIARNITGYPFGARLDDKRIEDLIDKVWTVFEAKDGWEKIDFSALGGLERASYCEKHLVSREFAEQKEKSALIVNKEKSVYIMVPEEDHIRIQAIKPGFDIDGAAEAAYEAEGLIDASLDVAYSEKFGYITHCPTNLGSGMRASVMLYLPVYAQAGGIKSLSLQLSKIGMTVRGMEGEGSGATANLYQISNQVTLGVGEEETVRELSEVIRKIIDGERSLRGKLNEETREGLEDRVMRDFGTMMYATRLSGSETVKLYSEMRLGSALALIKLSPEKLDKLLIESMPNTICAAAGSGLTPNERDKLRAAVVKRIISEK